MNTAIRDSISGKAVPVMGDDLDTDRIVPARFLKEITFTHMGNYLFYDQRFEADGTPKTHPLNDPQFLGARIMIVGRNFGCGSSREHAPQAIMRFGIQAIIGDSFAEIFAGNCKAIGVPVVTISEIQLSQLVSAVQSESGTILTLSLADETLTYDDTIVPISLPESRRQAFLSGTWEASTLLRNNLPMARKLAQSIPYFSNFS